MHCPGCGRQDSTEQKFCRACGMNLEVVSKALAAHGVHSDSDDSHAVANRRTFPPMLRWISRGIIIMFAGAFLGMVGKKFVHNEILSGVGALVAIIGMFLVCFGSLPRLASGKGKSRSSKPATAPAQAKPTLPLPLELPPESIPSVTESTTELLGVEKIKVSAHHRN